MCDFKFVHITLSGGDSLSTPHKHMGKIENYGNIKIAYGMVFKIFSVNDNM